jgi:glycosyltransferase involved in cell wall biosynthesis
MLDITILIPNYNNAIYLEECLNSVFSQNMNDFSFLVLINDDKSTDNSIEIIQKYVDLYKEKIILFQNEMNKGTLYTTVELYKKINSKYFTVLDSDDYWIDDTFLSRSITFLNENENYSIYGENSKLLYSDKSIQNYRNTANVITGGLDANTYSYQGPHTSAAVFRSKIDKELINTLENIYNDANKGWKNKISEQIYEGDFFRNTYFSYGKTMCNYNNFAGCYRIITKNTRWCSLTNSIKDILNILARYEIIRLFPNNSYKVKYFLNEFLKKKQNINIPDKIMYNKYEIKKNEIIDYLSEMEKNAYDILSKIK